MAYSQGGLIQAIDYNGLASTNSANVSYVLGVGSRDWGYGQNTTMINSVANGATVTAAQWAGLVYSTNKCLAHQGGTQIGGGLGGANINMTAGQTITYFSNVSTAVTTIGTNRAVYSTTGTTTTGTTFRYVMAMPNNTFSYDLSFSRVVSIASADQARYFFNAGGRLNFIISSATNNTATSRGADWVTLLQTDLAGINYFATATGGRGAGGTVNVNNTSLGYWNNTTTLQTVYQVSSASGTYTYATDYAGIQVKTFGVQGTNNDNGADVVFTVFMHQTAYPNSNWNDSVSSTISQQIDVVRPETTYLSDVWGTITTGFYSYDIFNQFNRGQTTGNQCNLSQDTATAGPLGTSTPLRMDQLGNDTYTSTYSGPQYNIAVATSGQTWEITVWMKASTSISAEGAWIAEADAAGNYLIGGGSPFPSLTTSWQQVTSTYTTTNASCAFVQCRLDGTQTGGAGITVWWDNLRIRRIA